MCGTGAYIVAGSTLTPGGVVTIDGKASTIAPGGHRVLVEDAAKTGQPNVAGAIMGVLGVMTKAGDPPSASATSTTSGLVEVQTSSANANGAGVSRAAGLLAFGAWLLH